MRVSQLQAILGIMVVGIFLVVTAVVALVPVIGGYPPDKFAEHLKSFASVYSGIVGLVVGFFFGRRTDADR